MLDSDETVSSSDLNTLSSPELLRRPDTLDESEWSSSVGNFFCKKNSTLLECKEAVDIDLHPEPENVSNIFKEFPKMNCMKTNKRTKTIQSKDPSVKQHLSTTVSGKKVFKMTPKSNQKPCTVSSAKLEKKKVQPTESTLYEGPQPSPSTPGTKLYKVEAAPNKKVQATECTSYEVPQPSPRTCFVHANPSIPGSTVGKVEATPNKLLPTRKEICSIIKAPLCPHHSGMRRVIIGKYKPHKGGKKSIDFLLD
ncbi:meiosis-specific kinetochore protein-like [Pelobates fuscus]|uniref:meiosis-specific kinetochore protein-like n=1 Tax=Pelobates fuscus TaxID=191477 RepID=UPI002FE42F4A